MTSREDLARSFGAAAHTYERGRPEYPEAAAAWMLRDCAPAGRPARVADVGAGTGKLTRALVAAGADVVAVDPDEAMLARLRDAAPSVPTLAGTAESLPLADGVLDAVVLGQAWHWVDPPRASTEIARVLRPAGVLGLIWNIRDERVGWVAEMTRIMHGSDAEAMVAGGGPTVGAPFGPLEEQVWTWTRPMTRTQLQDMAASRSYAITSGPAERARIASELSAMFERIVAPGEDLLELPYVTHAYRTVRG